MTAAATVSALPTVGAGLPPALVARILHGLAGSAEPVTSIAPLTGAPNVTLPQSTAADVAIAFDRARDAQEAWAALPVTERAKPFLRLHDLLLDRQAEGLDLVQTETGKARLHAFEEILDGAGSTLYYARNAARLLRDQRRVGALPVFTKAVESARPKGVVATITPWNYPLALTMDVVPALLAGNAVVHKPDAQTALSSLWPRSLAIEAGLPAELWQVVLGDVATVGNPLIDCADYVGFTGSTAAGKVIAERAAGRLIGCSLELGGKNAMLVLADADLDRAAAAAVRGCFANAGQLCVSMERIYVHRSLYPRFVDTFSAAVAALRLGGDRDFSADVGSLTTRTQWERVVEHVEQAKAAGATVRAGGRARPDLGPFFYEPTVLTDVPCTAVLCREETFGPVVSVAPFDTEDEAIALVDDTRYGLNSSIFSRDVAHARALAARLHTGTVNINEPYAAAYASQGAPMGGMRDSGIGRRHGDGGLLKYTEAQTVASQSVIGFDPAFGLGKAQYARVFTVAMKALKAVRLR